MIKLKARRMGNSLGVLLPKEVIARLDLAKGAVLHLTEAPHGGYRLVPHDSAFAQLMAKAEDIMRRFRETLHVLSR